MMFRALFPDEVAFAQGDPGLPVAGLLSGEETYVRNASEGRRREFAAGRAAARRALASLGLPAAPIPAGPDRAPIWPDGFVGSISHCAGLCLAAVAPADAYSSIGIDVEPAEPLPQDILDTVCTPAERRRLETRPPERRGLLARAIFSAKETAYKCQYPLTGALIDFHAFDVTLEDGAFRAVFSHAVGRFAAGDSLEGRIAVSDAFIVSAISLPRHAPQRWGSSHVPAFAAA